MTQIPLLQKWFEEVWHKGNENAIDELLHPNAVVHGLGTDETKSGPEAFKPFYKSFRDSFPVVQVESTPIFSNDEFEAADCVVTCTNAEGKNAKFTGICISKFKDGKLFEGWNGFDFLSMHQQLGFKLTKEDI